MIYMIFSKNPILELLILCSYLDTVARDGTEFFSSQSTFLMTTFPPCRHYTISLLWGEHGYEKTHTEFIKRTVQPRSGSAWEVTK